MKESDVVNKKINNLCNTSLSIAAICFAIYCICETYLTGILENFSIIILLLTSVMLFFSIFGCVLLMHSTKIMIEKMVTMLVVGLILIAMFPIIGSQWYLLMGNKNDQQSKSIMPVEDHNDEFVVYEGEDSISGQNVIRLINKVINHNETNKEDSLLWINVHVNENGKVHELEGKGYFIADGNEAGTLSVEEYNRKIKKALAKVEIKKKYAIRCGYDSVTGYVVDIEIVLKEE